MKCLIERTEFEVVFFEGLPVQWNIAFKILSDKGEQYVPITVYRKDIPAPVTEAAIMRYAAREMLPGQISMLYSDKDILSGLDQQAEKLQQEKIAFEEEEKEKARIEEEQKTQLEEARIAFEARKKEAAQK